MNKAITSVGAILLPISLAVAAETQPMQGLSPEMVTAAQVRSVQSKQTYTYVRCWYRTSYSTDDPATDWEWAENSDGSYFTIDGYWWSAVSFKNMFYTNTSQSEIRKRCEETLDLANDNADITYFAADNRWSYNHTIWSNDSETQPEKINKVVAFGDSLSDTGNIFNASQWKFPNPNSWFLGHFSNGLVWTEYIAKEKQLPVYNWAVGGAAGENQYIALTGVGEQVSSYLTYMKMAKNYLPANTLFTLEFGLNDFMNYGRSVAEVKSDYSEAMIRLTDAGAENLLLMTLPDATRAPQFKYSSQEEIDKIRAKILEMNAFIESQAQYYIMQGYKITLYDTYTLFESLTSAPQQHGFANASEACLDINRSSAIDYLYRHGLRNECANLGADKFVFWDVTHPTTATHRYVAERMLESSKQLMRHPF
ncbi:SGNH/GDSL hydrolase family protein [Vibrio paucivorans]|uniref:SGNH/GDSL hydrolase family protein n=1 Tax=Vibrio paucivorans TaxID=2829489 RepID=A0A9X3HSF4_9VIBR|nr:SGNH/GDSL hydrolase family protein [Vibrio paucivorans]MCW8334751.1 SGNH/GDSL hydrolase family protein [Vibrio paucivorans]